MHTLHQRSRLHGAVRTRGDYTAQAPYGSSAYWRAAIGWLQSQEGLRYDLQDYARLLEAIDVAAEAAEVSVSTVAGRSTILRQCSFYLLRQGREGFGIQHGDIDIRIPQHSGIRLTIFLRWG